MSELSALLEREASAEIEVIVSEARRRASELSSGAQAEAEQLLAQRRRVAEVLHEAAAVRSASAAQLEASALKLRAQHEAVQRVFDGARERLVALAADATAYRPVLVELLSEAVENIGAADVAAVQASAEDVAAVRSALKGLGLQVPVEADPQLSLGVRVRSKRRSAVENTLGARLGALEGDLAAEVSRILFAADAAPGATRPEGG